MKAIVNDRYGSSDTLEYIEIDRPVAGTGELVVRVHAADVDRGVWHLMAGLPYLARVIGFGFRRPKDRVRGRAFAGSVEAVGPGVDGFRPGDAVYGTCNGSFAEYALVRPERCAPMPANLTAAQAASVPISADTALQALRAGGVAAGQKVLVIGAAGGVGTFAVQLARHFGAEVTGVCSTAKVDLVASLGATEVIDYTRDDFATRLERYDLILDIAGNRPLSRLRRALTPKGTLVLVGGEDGGRWTGGMGRSLRAALLSLFVGQTLRPLLSTERAEHFRALRELAEAGAFTPVIDRTFPLSEAAKAMRILEETHARGKIVLTVP